MKRSDFESFMGLARETSSLILTNLRRAADLVQGFKQVSVDQSSERRRVFDIREYLEEVVASLHPEYAKQGTSSTSTSARHAHDSSRAPSPRS